MDAKECNRVVCDPAIMTGKPVIRGTRITVEAIQRRAADGMGIPDILEEFPRLKRADITAALTF